VSACLIGCEFAENPELFYVFRATSRCCFLENQSDPYGTDFANECGMRDEREIRIAKLKRQIEEAAGEKPTFGTAADCPPEIEEDFLRQVLAHELAMQKDRSRPPHR